MAGELKTREDAAAAINRITAECDLSKMADTKDFATAMKLAKGVSDLRTALTPAVMADVMALQNSALGYLTDRANSRDNGPKEYPVEVVRDCLIEALLRGLRPVNNEFNIISGRMYAAKNGMKRLVREFPGLSDLDISLTIATWDDTEGKMRAQVKFVAAYKLAGVKVDPFERTVPVRINKGQGYDAVLGKAERKGLAQLYARLTNTEINEGDSTEIVEAVAEKKDARAEARTTQEKITAAAARRDAARGVDENDIPMSFGDGSK